MPSGSSTAAVKKTVTNGTGRVRPIMRIESFSIVPQPSSSAAAQLEITAAIGRCDGALPGGRLSISKTRSSPGTDGH